MNDRFKFRVWDKERKFFDPTYCLDVKGRLSDVVEDYEGCGDLRFESIPDQERYIIQQCTGLKDKNGKLIFEGDVLITPDELLRQNYSDLGIVEYLDATFEIKYNEADYTHLRYAIDIWEVVVIGNIFENKELLK